MNVLSRSWPLFTATLGVLREEKSLSLYPLTAAICAAVCSVLVLGGSMLLLTANPALAQALEAADDGSGQPQWLTAVSIALLFSYYLVVYFTASFFMTALVGVALKRLEGGDPGFTEGLANARRRAGIIFSGCAIAATVGVLLSLLRSRLGPMMRRSCLHHEPALVSRFRGKRP